MACSATAWCCRRRQGSPGRKTGPAVGCSPTTSQSPTSAGRCGPADGAQFLGGRDPVAGAVPASYVPDASAGRTDLEGFTGADGVEDDELRTYCVADARPLAPGAVAFLDGIEQWRVVGYGGVTPIVRGYVAAAVRRRGP